MLLLAMAYGSTLALLVVAVGFTTLIRNGVEATSGAVKLERAGAGPGHDHGKHDHGNDNHQNTGKPVNIHVETDYIDNLVLRVRAEVTKNRQPLTKATVVAYTDMVQMPGVHTQGPLPLRPTGKAGFYETQLNVSMPGDYKVRVVVKDPVRVEKITEVPIGTGYQR